MKDSGMEFFVSIYEFTAFKSSQYLLLQLEDAQLPSPSMEEQAAMEGNPTKLQTWTYVPANAVM